MTNNDYQASKDLDQMLKEVLSKFPCCICGSPSSYFLKDKVTKIARAYCDKCSTSKKLSNIN